jgi:thiamine biosynthesis lipoprotein ApbE
MKKIFLFAAIAAMIGVASCNSNKKAEAERARLEAVRVADSLYQIHVADSIRAAFVADSLQQVIAETEEVATTTTTTKSSVKKPAVAPKEEVAPPAPVIVEEKPATPSTPAERNAAIAKEKQEKVQDFRNK